VTWHRICVNESRSEDKGIEANKGGAKEGRLATPFYNFLPLWSFTMLRKALLSVVPVLLLGTAVWAFPQGATRTVPVSNVKVVKESDSEDGGAAKRGNSKGIKKGWYGGYRGYHGYHGYGGYYGYRSYYRSYYDRPDHP
jgi:hypothetical protein